MAEKTLEYISFFSFFALAVVAVLVETQWLKKRGVPHGRALVHALMSDIVGFSVGGFLVFVVMLALLMMTLGPAGAGSDIGNFWYILVVSVGAVATPVTLFLIKRISMAICKVSTGGSAWGYSFISAIVTFLAVCIPPPVIFYLGSRFI